MDHIAEIKRLYYEAKPATVARHLAKAIALLKELPTEEERERAAVYMDGLSQMRSEWATGSGDEDRQPAAPGSKKVGAGPAKRTTAPGKPAPRRG